MEGGLSVIITQKKSWREDFADLVKRDSCVD